MRQLLLIIGAVLLCMNALAQDSEGLNPSQQERYRLLIEELRCLVCQNQNIAESNAPLARDLRKQVEEMIVAGRSDAEIKDYMTARYGDFVLYRPPVKRQTWLLWFGPPLLLLGVIITIWLVVRRRDQKVPEVDESDLQRILSNNDGHGREDGP